MVLANLLSNAIKYSPDGSPITVATELARLGDHLTRPQQGVGLGLFIARRSLDQMGGEIWCDERPGGGARFGFSLPTHAGGSDEGTPGLTSAGATSP